MALKMKNINNFKLRVKNIKNNNSVTNGQFEFF